MIECPTTTEANSAFLVMLVLQSTLLKVLGGLVPYTKGIVNVQQPTGFVFQV
jgi:hypothetical protein